MRCAPRNFSDLPEVVEGMPLEPILLPFARAAAAEPFA
jgi:hypothetical protein